MTVEELIELLEKLDRDSIIRLAEQKTWPLEYEIGDVVEADTEIQCPACLGQGFVIVAEDAAGEPVRDRCPDCAGDGLYFKLDPCEGSPVVYIVEGAQLGYLPQTAVNAIGWSNK